VRIAIATPAPRGSRKGNRITAVRWAGHLRALGHRVGLLEAWSGELCDLLVALHATRSHRSVLRWREAHPRGRLVVGLAGTDLYQDLPASREARSSLELADRLTVLQPRGILALPPEVRHKARAIVQSASPVAPEPAPPGLFRVALLAHLREVKGPFLAAEATGLLPAGSRLELVHLGAALDAGAEERARREMAAHPRYRWLGPLRHGRARAIVGGSKLLVITSRLEGGSNALSEALAAGVPVLSTRVDGSVGILGEGYPGFYPVGDAPALAALLRRAESEPGYLAELRRWVDGLRPLVDPAREREAWRSLLAEMGS